MRKHFWRNALLLANGCMFMLCYYAYTHSTVPNYEELKTPEYRMEIPEVPVAKGLRSFAQHKSRPKTQVLSQVKLFPRGGDDLDLQPWPLPVAKIYASIEELPHGRYVLANFSYSPGLGNLMFQYAGLRSLAEDHNATLLLPSTTSLRRAFGNFDEKVLLVQPAVVDRYLVEHQKELRQFPDCCRFYPNIKLFQTTSYNPEQHIEAVEGYFQSFKYFHPHRSEFVKQQFKFLPRVQGEALKLLDNAKFANWNTELNLSEEQGNDVVLVLPENFQQDYFFVAMHVRHGLDITMHSRNLRHGHAAATLDFYRRAMKHFQETYHWRKVVFVIASDDIEWTKKNFVPQVPGQYLFVDSGQREIDMATLASCNATIMSTGTFSWWIGYLSGGTVVYFKDWPRSGSELEHLVNKADYFLPKWRAI